MNIEAIDEKISEQISFLKNEIPNLKFETYFEFKILDAQKSFIKEELNFQGIYLIEINNNLLPFEKWIKKFKINWESKTFHNRPRLRKKSIDNLKIKDSWIPLYIGKSKRIGDRVFEHLFLENKKSTYALKLSSKEFLKNEVIRIKTINIDVKNYDQIVPYIESELRNEINPIIGRQ